MRKAEMGKDSSDNAGNALLGASNWNKEIIGIMA